MKAVKVLKRIHHVVRRGLAHDLVWRSRRPSGYMTAFRKAGVPTLGLEEEVGCSPRVTFDGKVRNLGPCVLKFDSPS